MRSFLRRKAPPVVPPHWRDSRPAAELPPEAEELSEGAAPPRWTELLALLAADPRPFDELSLEERRARVTLLLGSLETSGAASAELLSRREEEIELEEAGLVRASG